MKIKILIIILLLNSFLIYGYEEKILEKFLKLPEDNLLMNYSYLLVLRDKDRDKGTDYCLYQWKYLLKIQFEDLKSLQDIILRKGIKFNDKSDNSKSLTFIDNNYSVTMLVEKPEKNSGIELTIQIVNNNVKNQELKIKDNSNKKTGELSDLEKEDEKISRELKQAQDENEKLNQELKQIRKEINDEKEETKK